MFLSDQDFLIIEPLGGVVDTMMLKILQFWICFDMYYYFDLF
jgi:hypothetical protein